MDMPIIRDLSDIYPALLNFELRGTECHVGEDHNVKFESILVGQESAEPKPRLEFEGKRMQGAILTWSTLVRSTRVMIERIGETTRVVIINLEEGRTLTLDVHDKVGELHSLLTQEK